MSTGEHRDAQAARPPLHDLLVLDLTQIYNGPYATFLLAQAGATVVKIEPPQGEHLRKRDRARGVAEPFAVLNGNKHGMTLNLRTPAGRDALLAMAAKADVLVENYAPGVMQRLGLDEAALRAANPDIILASSSGYGSTGPYRDYPAMDLTVQAMSGVMSTTGMPDGPPLKAGPALCDFFAGVHLYGAVVTALYDRATTGRAGTVEVAMLDAVYPSLLSSLGLHRRGERGPARTGNRHGGLTMAPYNVYPARDGALAILAVSDAHWHALAQALEQPAWLAAPEFADRAARVRHIDRLDAAIAAITRTQARDELCSRLIEARVPCAPVRDLDEVVHDEHLHATGMLRWIEHPLYGEVLVHGSPLRFRQRDTPAYRASPALGADTHAVLQTLFGLDDEALASLAEAGAFH